MTILHEDLQDRASRLHYLSTREFVLWDKDRKRGWLVRGETAALHLLRVRIKDNKLYQNFDFSALQILKDVADDLSPAYRVLAEFCPKDPLTHPNDFKKKPGNSESGEKPKTPEEERNETIGKKLDEIIAVLFRLVDDAGKLNPHRGLLGPFRTWYDETVGPTLRGWDFKSVSDGGSAMIDFYKMDKDPGWLQMVRDREAIVLFGDGLGEVLEPRAGSCCPYFPTLPIDKNLLASDMQVIRELIMDVAGDEGINPPDKTVARLSFSQGWVRGLDPFARPNCRGDHLDTLEPSCFPVQSLQDAPRKEDLEKRRNKDIKLLDGKKLYTKKEIQVMIAKHPRGVVVFGSQPGPEELRNICRRSNPQNLNLAAQEKASADSTVAPSSNRPSSRSSAHSSTGRPALPPAAPAGGTGQRTRPSGQRTPSISSIRSNVSNTQSRASGNGTDTGQPQALTPKPTAPSVQKVISNASLRSNGSNVHAKASQVNITGAEGPQPSTFQSPATTLRNAASNASLRSTNSITRSSPPNAGPGRSNEASTHPGTAKVTRKPSNSSVSSVASGSTGGSQPQRPSVDPSAEASAMGLKKTFTNSSNKTTSSHSSRGTQSSAAGSTAARNRQRQQQLDQAGNATAVAGNLVPGQPISSNHGTSSAGTTGNSHSNSSGPDASS